jgi:hypothetical protein
MLGLPGDFVATSLLPLGSLLVIPDMPSDSIRIIHPSFPDFLTQSEPRRCVDDRFFVDLPVHHARLAHLCFSRMYTLFKQGSRGIEGDAMLYKHSNDVPVDLQYACKHWADRLSNCRADDSPLLDDLYSLFSLHFLHWLEVLSVTKSLDVALPCLNYAETWIKVG